MAGGSFSCYLRNMKNYTPTLLICILLLAGCIKHPGEPPAPPRPQWLMNKIVEITERYGLGLPGDPPIGRSKSVWEIEYNQYYKPRLLRIYYSTGNDTLNLQLIGVDTLFYDAQHRVKEMRSLSATDGRLTSKLLSYNGNDTLPSRAQTMPSGWTVEYAYKGDTVVTITTGEKGMKDTTRHIYPGGNLTHYYAFDIAVGQYRIDVYESYDDGFSIYRAMNLSQGNLFTLPFDWYETPRLSRNNWTHATTVPADRYVQYNAQGLPVSSSVQEYYPERRHLSRYEYFATTP